MGRIEEIMDKLSDYGWSNDGWNSTPEEIRSKNVYTVGLLKENNLGGNSYISISKKGSSEEPVFECVDTVNNFLELPHSITLTELTLFLELFNALRGEDSSDYCQPHNYTEVIMRQVDIICQLRDEVEELRSTSDDDLNEIRKCYLDTIRDQNEKIKQLEDELRNARYVSDGYKVQMDFLKVANKKLRNRIAKMKEFMTSIYNLSELAICRDGE